MTTKLNVLQVIPKLGYGGSRNEVAMILLIFLPKMIVDLFIATSGELLKFVKKESKIVQATCAF